MKLGFGDVEDWVDGLGDGVSIYRNPELLGANCDVGSSESCEGDIMVFEHQG